MNTLTDTASAQAVIATLRAHGSELRQACIVSLSLFGSVARGDADAARDVDLVGRLDPTARIDLVDLISLERILGNMLGLRVDRVPEPIEAPGLRRDVERDRLLAC